MSQPDGFRYTPDFLDVAEEQRLLGELERLTYGEVRMHGVVARRTVIHYGFDYDYSGWKIHPTDPPPAWLEPLIVRAAEAAGVARETFAQFLIARYPPGATIGWHRDAPMFGNLVAGVSLAGDCVMKLRRKTADGFEIVKQPLAARSLYVLSGSARTQWQHAIPATKALRYSITMRSVRNRT
jgi:alkylated DNA repair protein (DNA oxidative demethylase)